MGFEKDEALAKVENVDQSALMNVSDVVYRMDCVTQLMRDAMKNGPDGDYGIIPGTGNKPTLLKPGAEKLCTLFRLAPQYKIEVSPMARDHREYSIICTLTHINTGKVWGEGAASCSTMESKYRWRNGQRKCPQCSKETIIKGKAEYGGGFICFNKKGGCGAKFGDNDPAITKQEVGRVENPDIADVYNTVLKMATKRALVAAVLITTGASALFTQDIEENANQDHHDAPEREPQKDNPQNRQQPTQSESDKISAAMVDLLNRVFPATPAGKKAAADAVGEAFGTKQWKSIISLPIDDLRVGADKLFKMLDGIKYKEPQAASAA